MYRHDLWYKDIHQKIVSADLFFSCFWVMCKSCTWNSQTGVQLRHTSKDPAINISVRNVSLHKLLLERYPYPVVGQQLQQQWGTVVTVYGTLLKTLISESVCRLFASFGKLPWSSCSGSLCVMTKSLMLTGLNLRRSITSQVTLTMISTSDIQVSTDLVLKITQKFCIRFRLYLLYRKDVNSILLSTSNTICKSKLNTCGVNLHRDRICIILSPVVKLHLNITLFTFLKW